MFGLFKKSNPDAGKTIVYMRDLFSQEPARHWESPVDYDVWGTPFAYDYEYGKRPVLLKSNGRFGSYDWQDWKHKSGPAVNFGAKNGDPKTSWFPKNPNDDLPL